MKGAWEAVKFWQVDHPDNFVEEIAEDAIESTTGAKFDLTPFTGEERQNFEVFKKEF